MALNLNGTQYATLGSSITTTGTSGAGLWAQIKFSGTQTNGASIIDLSTDTNGNGGNRMVMGFADNNKIYFEVFTNNVSLGRIVTPNSVSADAWHSVVATIQPSGSTRTATIFIDGVSIQTGTFSALPTPTTYTNKFIGKSTVTNDFFNGQIFDVSVQNSGLNPRASFTTVGFPENTFTLAYASLNSTTDILFNSSAPSGQVTLLNNPSFVATSSASLLLSLDIRLINLLSTSVTEANSFASIAIKVAGLYDGSSEKLVFASPYGQISTRREMDLSGSSTSGTVASFSTVNSLAWTYSNGTYTFRRSQAGSTLSIGEVLDFIRSLAYYNSALSATDGARTFTITTTDTAGNESAAVVSTVVVDTLTPTINTTPVMLDANNDFIKGDEFIIQFAERVQTTPITTNST
ncbi:MAG: LamG domain-containing protein, partial [Betaproteobacteria bacterium]|nr:LamG domain-containing protein [Betaproteobacteria bacterium]